MFDSKYSKVLTVILVIVIIAIIALLGFLGYDYYKKTVTINEAEKFVENFHNEETENNEEKPEEKPNQEKPEEKPNKENPFEQIESNQPPTSNGTSKKPQYKGFETLGTIEIPKINLKYPIIAKLSKKSLETSVVFLSGTGINQPGNSVIIGHNYNNGLFFSNVKRLKIGDKIYLKDNSGKKLTYTIYKKFEADKNDTSFYQRDTNNKPEITLSTCTDHNNNARLIIFGRID